MDISSGTRHPLRKALYEALIVLALLAVGSILLAHEMAPRLPAPDRVAAAR